LAKVAIVFDGGLASLAAQRTHGASWSGITRRSQDLLTDHVTLHEKGSLALFYTTITGDAWPSSPQKTKAGGWISSKKQKVELKLVYPSIYSIGYEFCEAYGRECDLDRVAVRLARVGNAEKWRVLTSFSGSNVAGSHHFTVGMTKSANASLYQSKPVSAKTPEEARQKMESKFRWHLLHHVVGPGGVETYTSRKRGNIQMPQEFAILLAFFHLGNVVRYDPERLGRLVDSRACSMIDAARRHAVLDYVLAIWSFVKRRTVLISG